MFRGTIVRIQEWQRARRQRRIERLTAKAADLEEGKQYDLLFLHGRGFVRARGTGQSITRIYGEIENLIAKKLRVVIKPGTYFVARGNCQNMVTREEYTMILYPTSKESVSIDAAYINANMPIPGKDDRFYGVRRVSDDLARFLEASGYSDAFRPPIPTEVGHPFRGKPATDSDGKSATFRPLSERVAGMSEWPFRIRKGERHRAFQGKVSPHSK